MTEQLIETLEELEDDLLGRAFLFDHPTTYREAIESAMCAVRALLSAQTAAA